MARQRIFKDHVISNVENQHRIQDRAASIDEKLDAAFARIDWQRRNDAEKSIVKWVQTYCVPLLLQDAPSDKGNEVLEQMAKAITSHSNYMICMPRGQGKTSFVECVTLYALATGIQKYVVCISNNARAAAGIMQDIWRAIAETDTPFAQDYPSVGCPFHLCNGAFRRRQTYRGKLTELQKNASNIVLARLQDESGNELPTSNSILTCRGISSGLRGMKFGKLRPTLVLLDDLQSSEIAENPSSVQKLLNTIKKDVMPLGGKERLSILQTATPIQPEDAVELLKRDKAWKTSTYRGIESYPTNMDLWKEYFKLFDAELVEDTDHKQSLDFYKKHFDEMNAGSEVFNPQRYSESDGHISAIQKLLEIQHMIGDAAFQSEYQMKPKRFSFKLDITAKDVTSKAGVVPQLVVPDGFVFVAASTDLNLSYAMTTTLVAFKPDMTAHVLHHFFTPCKIDMKLADADYNKQVYDALMSLGNHLKSLRVKIDGWGIDASGRPFDAVTLFAKHSPIPACAMLGRASHVFNPFVRSRLRDAINRTVLCGDAQEHVKAGAGQKYQFWDSDYYRVAVHKAFLAQPGSSGSCSLYIGDVDEHSEYALQVCNERLILVQHKSDGRDFYTWKSQEPHDCLDSTAQAFAIAASQGISGQNIRASSRMPAKHTLKRRQRIKLV